MFILRVNLVSENESIYHLLFLITAGSSQATPRVVTGGWKGKKWDGTNMEAPAFPMMSPCCLARVGSWVIAKGLRAGKG